MEAAAGQTVALFFMGLFNFLQPKLTEEIVTIAEQKAAESKQQLEWMRRYAKAQGQTRVNRAETGYVFRLGQEIASVQVNQFKDENHIQAARKSAEIAAKNSIDTYAKSLILRGTK